MIVWDIGAFKHSNEDTTPPLVFISLINDLTTVSGITTLLATAIDNTNVASVQFKLDGANIGPLLTTKPYSISWDTSTTSNAKHIVSATVTDVFGLSTSNDTIINVYNKIVDTTPPIISGGKPTGILPAGTTSVYMVVTTNEVSTCKWAASSGVAYTSMIGSFTTSDGVTHSTNLTGLTDGKTYSYYVKAKDAFGNITTSDFVVNFSIASLIKSITVLGPPAGSIWRIGETRQIQWTSSGVNSNVKIEVLRSGAHYVLFSSTPNTGSINWVVTGPANISCRFLISSLDGSVVGYRNDFFTIK